MKHKIWINFIVGLALVLGSGGIVPRQPPVAHAASMRQAHDATSRGNLAPEVGASTDPANAVSDDHVWHIGGPMYAVAVAGQYAYVGEGFSLTILDISAPSAPVVVGRLEFLPDIVQALAVAGDYAYVVDGQLRVIDVRDPVNPIEVGSYDTPGIATDVVVSGGYAYVTDDYAGLWILDVSDPAILTAAGFYNTPGIASGVDLAGTYAYVADGTSGLRVIDVSDPAKPIEVGFTYVISNEYMRDVAVAGDYAYVAAGMYLRVIDVSDPANPALVGSTYVSYPWEVAVAGSYAYVAAWGSGLRIMNVLNPTNPFEVGACETPGSAQGVALMGAYAYVVDGGGLGVVDISNPASPNEVGSYQVPEGAQLVTVVEGYAYIGGLLVIDVSDLSDLSKVGTYAIPVIDMAIEGDYAYAAAGESGLRVIDLSDPAQPDEVGFTYTAGSPVSVAVAGSHAYVADGFSLAVIDVSDPAKPVEVGWYQTPGDAQGVAVVGSFAYVADGSSGLRVIDVSDPANPSEVGFYHNPMPGHDFHEIAVAGNYAYITGFNGLWVIDVSDPMHPAEVGFWPAYLAEGGDLTLNGDYAFITNGADGLRIIDVFDPAQPREAGFYDTPGSASGVAVVGNYAYVADGSGGLIILDHTRLDLKIRTVTNITIDAPNPSPAGQPIPVSFQVAAGSGVPSGMVTLTVPHSTEWQECTVPLVGSVGGCEIQIDASGTYTMTASYSGDDHFLPSSAVAEHSYKINTAITILSDEPDPSQAGEPVTLNYRVESLLEPTSLPGTWLGGTVTVTAAGEDASCTSTSDRGLGNCEITLNTPGHHTLTASYSGDDDFFPSSVVEEHQVGDLPVEPSSRIFLPNIMNTYCTDFFDDFSDPSTDWEVGEDEFARYEYLNGEYRIRTKDDQFLYFSSAPVCDRESYVVEVEAHWAGTPGASYGIVFGIFGNYDQYYTFEVNTDYRDFGLWRFDGQDYHAIVPITPSGAINSGTATNRLRVTRNGSQITLQVNGVILGTWTDGNINGKTGVGVLSVPYDGEPVSDARFDNFFFGRSSE